MWVVTACKPFEFVAKEWSFPIVGSFPYKGFFDREKARIEMNRLKEEGWDVSVRNPGGWSTLGWFTDPILSKMLERSDGDLANLIIHEMTHATLFVKDSVEFNENLASFIGDAGAVKFLEYKFGPGTRAVVDYVTEEVEYKAYVQHMLRGFNVLDSVYRQLANNKNSDQKKAIKEKTIRDIVEKLDTLSFQVMKNPKSRLLERLPNNTYFINFRRYEGQQEYFMAECQNRYGNNLKAYIDFLKTQYRIVNR
jgi:predicted aminopeptidase